jgi:hypothetical protein
MRFRREEIQSFHATDYDIDPRAGIVLLRYAFSGPDGSGPGAADMLEFEERIDLGGPVHLDPEQQTSFEYLVRLLHAVAGTSYYKAAAPGIVSIESGPLTPDELFFVQDVYDKGLREFAYKNGLPIPMQVEVRARSEQPRPVDGGAPLRGLAIPIGGGKDSIVVIEALRDLEPVLVAINPSPAALRVADTSGLRLVRLRRTIDPSLLELNSRGALNGHIPITAVISLMAIAAGYVHGYSTTVMALESSADEATRVDGSTEVNHQWSKSSECERELSQVLEGVAPGIAYGSALRDLSELEISRCFADLRQYHKAFRSCNRAFALTGATDGWCNSCPKCRFVFLMLATALDRKEMVGIFGSDLLGDPEQIDGFRDLFEIDRKPFECVGTRDESIEALSELAAGSEWAESAVVKALAPTTVPGPARRSPRQVLQTVRAAAESISGTGAAASVNSPLVSSGESVGARQGMARGSIRSA